MRDYITSYQSAGLPYGCTHYDMSKLKAEYEKTLSFIHKAKNKSKVCDNSQIGFLNARTREIVEEIMMIEEYLPFEKRVRLHKWVDSYRSAIYDSRNDSGFVPDEYKEIVDDPLIIVENKQFKEDLLDTLSVILTKKQYEIMYMYFVYNLTQNEIAQNLETSQQNISRIIEVSLEKIRESKIFSYFFKKYSKNGCIF